MVGNTVGTGRKSGVHWVSKVVKATVGAAEGKADIQHEWHIARKTNYIYDVTFFGRFCEDFKKMLRSRSRRVTYRACFKTYPFVLFKATI